MRVDTARAWRADDNGLAFPVAKPLLPSAERVLPYLREIDGERRYANHGPLVRRLEARLSERFGAPDAVTLLASGTAALTMILESLEVPPGRACIIPAWTFAATAHAAVQAGLIPWFVDVDPRDGALAPEAARALVAHAPVPVGAVIAVAPFGLPADLEGWVAFRDRTGIPVVLDAAAGFDAVRASAIPTAVSLHATKVLGIGEGGLALWDDAAGVTAIRRRANFGFAGSREATSGGTNAKLSEYAAAVGLAALDGWPAARADFQRVAREYRAAFAAVPEVAFQPGYGRMWIAATTIVRLPSNRLAAVEDALAEGGFGSRRWWGDGLTSHRAFAAYPAMPLPVTSQLASTTLGLPCWRDLPTSEIERIAALVTHGCRTT